MSILDDVNEPLAIKLCDNPNESSAVYLLILMINTLFVEQISGQINFFAENTKRSPAGQRKRFSFTDMQKWDKPGRLQRSSDTAVR